MCRRCALYSVFVCLSVIFDLQFVLWYPFVNLVQQPVKVQQLQLVLIAFLAPVSRTAFVPVSQDTITRNISMHNEWTECHSTTCALTPHTLSRMSCKYRRIGRHISM